MVGNGAKEAGKTIADASVRLFKALFKGSSLKEGVKREGIAEKYFDKYELQQLRTIYGLDTSKMTETTAKGRRRIITPTTSTKRAMNDIAKKTVSLVESSVKSSVNGVVAVINTSKEYIENLHSREWNPKYRAKGKPATDEATFANLHFTESEKRQIIAKLGGSYNENFNEGLHLAFTDSVNEAEKLFNRMTTDFIIAENTSQTSQFSSIVQQIEALETVIKDGTDNIPPLLKILGDICEYQCENKGTKGCRPG
ncbi:MAG: hypothetical protein LBO09_05985 [Candidatus Peribacteria bacterium]|jgi:hypothetical protein|nr:hypothetical protein [Candidatus Peribacteria bacterium]